MSKTLILTGWGNKDYACAAALALRHYKEADIYGVSKRRLPEFLENVKGYSEIAILGISLAGDPERLAKVLKTLKGKKVLLRWISVYDFPEWMDTEIKNALKASICGSDMLEAVSQTFAISAPDIENLYRGKHELSKKYNTFLEAAMYFYRNFQDVQAYSKVIRHIADKHSEKHWTDAERQMIEYYKKYGTRELVGKSEAITYLLEQINLIAKRPRARVLVFGESGTGKETVALQIHFKSALKEEPFIAFNCATVSHNLLESRFLGHEKGAFTGAYEIHRGLFEIANGGTLFLDEIAELPLEAQGILLRVLEGGRFQRLGSNNELEVDVRVIAATNRDLPAMVRDGAFRADLFQRLNVVQIRVPALREHKEDIPAIAQNYRKNNEMPGRLNATQNEALMNYDYPGNVRELNNLLERADILQINDYQQLIREHKEMNASLLSGNKEELPDKLDDVIRMHVKAICDKYNGNISKSAEVLEVSRNTVRKYLQEE